MFDAVFEQKIVLVAGGSGGVGPANAITGVILPVDGGYLAA